MKTAKFKKGFTLIEVLIAATIFALVMVIVASTLSWASTYNSRLGEMRKVGNDARKIMNMISDDIRQANGTKLYEYDNFQEITMGEVTLFNSASGVLEPEGISSPVGEENSTDKLIIVQKRQGKVIIYSFVEADKKIARVEISNIEWENNLFGSSSELEVVEFDDLEYDLNFWGYAPGPNPRDQQPFISFSLDVRSKGYDDLTTSYRSKIRLQSTVTSREYNIYE